MPTIPLFSTPVLPDAWHAVRSPGGFEWWNFDAEDESGSTRIVVDFFDGDPFDDDYRLQYRRYRDKPTRHAPPLPGDFARVAVSIHHHRAATEFACKDRLLASTEVMHVSIGTHTARTDADGTLHVHAGQGDSRVELAFKPAFTGVEEIVLTSEFRWIAAAPRCDVIGSITRSGQAVPFRGFGYHDHFFSPRPLGELIGLDWFRGHARMADSTWMVQGLSLSGNDIAAIKIARATAEGMVEVAIDKASIDLKPRLPWSSYPLSMEFSNGLSLRNPQMLKSQRCMRLTYDATIEGQHGTFFAEVVRTPGWR